MSLPRYDRYRRSTSPWLGQLPAHWSESRLKMFVDTQRAITYGIVQAGPDTASGVPYVRPADMTDECGVLEPSAVLRTAPDVANDYRRSTICTGDLVCSIGPSFGKVMVVPSWLDGGNLTQGTARVAVSQDNNPRYVFWVLRSRISIAQWDASIGGATFRALNLEPLANTALAKPPRAEQVAIAAFLDRETAKIDALIAEQEKLIALLAEKRLATISHAVTRGLDPNAPMKDSGVAWLGEVPAHWEVVKGSRVGTLFGSGPVSEDEVFEEGSVPYIKVGSLSAEGFEISNWNWYVREATAERLSPCSEFVVFPKRGAAIFLNKVNIVRCRALIDPNLMGWSIRRIASSEYIAYVLTVRKLQELADVSTVPQINNKHIEPEKFPIPPLIEQEAVVDFLAAECRKLDLLKAEAQRAVALLGERRSALIAAAVTGQIDVRGLVPQEAAAA